MGSSEGQEKGVVGCVAGEGRVVVGVGVVELVGHNNDYEQGRSEGFLLLL